jgi:hypothetical protein
MCCQSKNDAPCNLYVISFLQGIPAFANPEDKAVLNMLDDLMDCVFEKSKPYASYLRVDRIIVISV